MIRSIPVVLVLFAILGLIVLTERWQWHECRKVGHGALYCLVYDANSR